MKKIYAIYQNIWLSALYIGISLWVYQEVHPFTRMPMYDYPSDNAYTFKLTDTNGVLIPTKQITITNPGRLSHIYSTVCTELSIDFETNNQAQLQAIGKHLYTGLHLKPNTPPLQIHRVQIRWTGDSLIQNSVFMFSSLKDKE